MILVGAYRSACAKSAIQRYGALMATIATLSAANRVEASASAPFIDGYWWSHDGLRLHYRDYPGPDDANVTPVICIPGLTRNARDFEDVAPRLAQRRRVLAVDLRGRGESGFAGDPLTYVPLTYAQDISLLLDSLELERVAVIGTSLGGIVAMMLGSITPARVSGVVLNDVGPMIEPEGLARIRSYVGQGGTHRTWIHAAQRFAELADPQRFPSYRLEDWLRLVKRSYRLTREGRIAPDYDAKISEPFRVPGGEAGVDLWPALAGLAPDPVAVVRGANSDILSVETANEMLRRLPHGVLVTVPDTGHAPTLEEPDAAAAIDALLDRADANA